MAAPDAFAEESQRRRLVVVPHAAHGVGLVAAIEQTDQAGGVVVQINAVVPRPEAEEHAHLHHFDAAGVGVVGKLHLRDLGRIRRGGEQCEPENGHGDAVHERHVASRRIRGQGRHQHRLTPASAAAYFGRRWVRSSAAEHRLHTAGVTGSIPVAPTIVAQQVAKATSAVAAPDAVFTCEVGLRTGSARPASPHRGHHARSRAAEADLSGVQQRRGHPVAVSPR